MTSPAGGTVRRRTRRSGWPPPRSTPPCPPCDLTTGRCCWPPTASSAARATPPANASSATPSRRPGACSAAAARAAAAPGRLAGGVPGLRRQAAAHRPSVEALVRRLDPDGLPRIDRITDVYNAVSVAHQLPLGGRTAPPMPPPRLVGPRAASPSTPRRAASPSSSTRRSARSSGGTTQASPAAAGTAAVHPHPHHDGTSSAVFILDVPRSDDRRRRPRRGDTLTDALLALSPNARVHRRLLGASTAPAPSGVSARSTIRPGCGSTGGAGGC
jgi:hypothetical protein